MLTFVANLGYFLMLCAFITRDLLSLRSLLLVAQALIIVFAWRSGLPVIAFWNILFFLINSLMVAQILRERRRIVLSTDLRSLYEKHFAALTPPEFLRWWNQGTHEQLVDAPLTKAGARPDSLYFVLGGTARVSRDGQSIVDLSRGAFVAEMSLLTGDPANADVDAIGALDVVRWPRAELLVVRQRNPLLWTKIQSVLGHDLVEKIRKSERA